MFEIKIEEIRNLGNRIGLVSDTKLVLETGKRLGKKPKNVSNVYTPYIDIPELELLSSFIDMKKTLEHVDRKLLTGRITKEMLLFYEISNEYDYLIVIPDYTDFILSEIRSVIEHQLGRIYSIQNTSTQIENIIRGDDYVLHKRGLISLLKVSLSKCKSNIIYEKIQKRIHNLEKKITLKPV